MAEGGGLELVIGSESENIRRVKELISSGKRKIGYFLALREEVSRSERDFRQVFNFLAFH